RSRERDSAVPCTRGRLRGGRPDDTHEQHGAGVSRQAADCRRSSFGGAFHAEKTSPDEGPGDSPFLRRCSVIDHFFTKKILEILNRIDEYSLESADYQKHHLDTPGGDAMLEDLDAIDRKLLELLQHDGRISNADLARTVRMAPSAVFERVRRLEREGVIRGYGAQLDARALERPLLAFILVRTDQRTGRNMRRSP